MKIQNVFIPWGSNLFGHELKSYATGRRFFAEILAIQNSKKIVVLVGWVDVRKPNSSIYVEFSTSMLGGAALNYWINTAKIVQ